MELTAYGSGLLAVTQPSLRALDAAMSGIERTAKGRAHSISVGTTPWLAASVLPPAIREFREHRPDLRIQLFDGNLSTVARRVAAGKLELGLGLFERTPGVRRAPFLRFSLMVIRADKNAAFNRVSTRWIALNGQTLISRTSNYPHQQLIDKQLEKSGIGWDRGHTVNLLD